MSDDYERDRIHEGLDDFDAPREPRFRFTMNGTDVLVPGEPVNDLGTDGVIFDELNRCWRVIFNNRLHSCEWPYEYYHLAQQCYAELCNPQPDESLHFKIHPYNWEE